MSHGSLDGIMEDVRRLANTRNDEIVDKVLFPDICFHSKLVKEQGEIEESLIDYLFVKYYYDLFPLERELEVLKRKRLNEIRAKLQTTKPCGRCKECLNLTRRRSLV